jgi:hypothetical protein
MGQSILLPDNNMPSTPERTLYLVAYDVSDPRRLARVHRFMTGWKVGGQKSFYPEFDTFRLIAADFRTEPLKEQ